MKSLPLGGGLRYHGSGGGTMLHSFVRIHVHLVWSTKARERLLTKNIREVVRRHIIAYSAGKGIVVECMNVQIDHVHVLISLSSDQKIDDAVKLIKGESSHWINSENLVRPKFSWQRGYGAFSVSHAHVNAVRDYITHQDEHHRRTTYADETKMILMKYGYAASETDESVLERHIDHQERHG